MRARAASHFSCNLAINTKICGNRVPSFNFLLIRPVAVYTLANRSHLPDFLVLLRTPIVLSFPPQKKCWEKNAHKCFVTQGMHAMYKNERRCLQRNKTYSREVKNIAHLHCKRCNTLAYFNNTLANYYINQITLVNIFLRVSYRERLKKIATRLHPSHAALTFGLIDGKRADGCQHYQQISQI